MEFDIERLRELARLMQDHDLREVEISEGDSLLRLSRGAPPPPEGAAAAGPAAAAAGSRGGASGPATAGHGGAGAGVGSTAAAAAAAAAATAAAVAAAGDHLVRSPIVGTFYRAPAPGAPAFAEVGQRVRKGQTVCIIEAMKLMNEIESDVAGVIQEVLAENGAPIEYDQPLFRVRPD
jgi:acetyl-CoA carboxylase biotin carboxyl carrier protein